MLKRFIFSLLFAVLMQAAAFAGPVSLYVNNQPYPEPVLAVKGQVYAAVEEIFPAVKMKLVAQGRVLCAVSQVSSAENPCPEDKTGALLYVKGKPVTKGISIFHGKTWIALSTLASTLGYYYHYNGQTQIADLAAPADLTKIYANAPQESKQGAGGGGKKEEGPKEKEPLKVENMNWFMDPRTYEIRLSFNVTSKSKETVKGIIATLQYLDGYGKPMASKTFNIGTLDPGKSAKEDDYWINPSQVVVKPDVQLDWEGKKKEQ